MLSEEEKREKNRARLARWYAENKDAVNARSAQWAKDHPEEIEARKERARAASAAKMASIKDAWRVQNSLDKQALEQRVKNGEVPHTVRVVGYEDLYEISRDGEVRYIGINHSRAPVKKTCIDPKGYVRVTLSKDGTNRQKLLHFLLAEAFLVKGDGDYLVDHIDGDTANNDLSNLRWANQSVNQLNRHKLVAKSGITGVHASVSKTNPWMACGKLNGKIVYLGLHPTKDAARLAREAWEKSVGCTTSTNIRNNKNEI